MLFVNRAGWAHCFDAVASVTGSERGPLRSGRVKAAAPVRTWGSHASRAALQVINFLMFLYGSHLALD
jgi:hypothetical protein